MAKRSVSAQKSKPKAYGIKIDYRTYCYDSYRSPEPYGEWREECSFHMEDSFEITDEEGYYDLLVDFEPQTDTPYHVVYCVYSSGDSFGRSSGNHSFLAFVKTVEEARKLVDVFSKTGENDYCVKVDGVDYYLPWKGYFESLETLDFATVYLKKSH